MDAITGVDPNTIPINGTVYAVFYPWDGFAQTCMDLEDAIADVEKARTSGVPEELDATVIEITIREIKVV